MGIERRRWTRSNRSLPFLLVFAVLLSGATSRAQQLSIETVADAIATKKLLQTVNQSLKFTLLENIRSSLPLATRIAIPLRTENDTMRKLYWQTIEFQCGVAAELAKDPEWVLASLKNEVNALNDSAFQKSMADSEIILNDRVAGEDAPKIVEAERQITAAVGTRLTSTQRVLRSAFTAALKQNGTLFNALSRQSQASPELNKSRQRLGTLIGSSSKR